MVNPEKSMEMFIDELDDRVGKVAGFSLHAGVSARADELKKLERLCRYIARPAVSEKRLSLTANGNVRYQLKTPYRDGTTHVIFEPLDFIARLAALVPKPRVNLIRFKVVFAPNKHQQLPRVYPRVGRHPRLAYSADTADTTAARPAAATSTARLRSLSARRQEALENRLKRAISPGSKRAFIRLHIDAPIANLNTRFLIQSGI